MSQFDEYEQRQDSRDDEGEDNGVYGSDGMNILDVSFSPTHRTVAENDASISEYAQVAWANQDQRESNVRTPRLSYADKAGVAFQKFNWAYAVANAKEQQIARQAGKIQSEVPWNVLTQGVPDSWHSMLIQERNKYGDVAALAKRDALVETLATNTAFDSMSGAEQFGFGALAMIADPVNLAGLGVVGKVGQAANITFKAAQRASIINAGVNGGRAWLASGIVAAPIKLAGWASLGAAEGALMNAPQLAQDPTYTASDYLLDIAFDSVLGMGFGGVAHFWNSPKGLEHKGNLENSYRELQHEIQRKADPIQKPVKSNTDAATAAASKDVAQLSKREAESLGELPVKIEEELVAARREIHAARRQFATPESTALEQQRKALVQERKALLENPTPENTARVKELATELKKVDVSLKEHYKATDSDDIKALWGHARDLKQELTGIQESALAAQNKHAELQLKDIYTELRALKQEHLDLLGVSDVVAPTPVDLSPLEAQVKTAESALLSDPSQANQLKVKEAKANLLTAQQNAELPVQNNVPVDKAEARRRAIRQRIDELQEQRKDIVEKATPAAVREYASLRDISRVSKQVFDGAVLAVQGKFKKNSAMYQLINRHQALVREKNLSQKAIEKKQDELAALAADDPKRIPLEASLAEHVEVERLSADILRLLHSLPSDGVPEWLESAVREATHRQTHFTHKDIMAGILNDGVSDPEQALMDYVETLKSMKIWQGYDPQPVSASEFYRENSEWLNPNVDEAHMDSGDLDYMQAYVSKDLSYLRDLVRLNEFVKDKPELVPLVEQINGYTLTRLEQKERSNNHVANELEMELLAKEVKETLRDWGYIRGTQDYVDKFGELYRAGLKQLSEDARMPEWKDSRESWGATVRMTPEDMKRQAEREGLISGTQEYKDRIKQLRKSGARADVPDEVNVMGKRQSRVIETVNTDALDRDEISLAQNATYDGGDSDFVTDRPRSTKVQEKTLELVSDEPDAALLPKHVTTIRSESVYDKPTLQNIERMRNLVRTTVVKRAEALAIRTAVTEVDMKRRMESIVNGVRKDKQAVMKRALASKNLDNIVDVLRAAETVAAEAATLPPAPKKPKQKAEGEAPKEPTVKEQVDEAPPRAITEEDLEQLDPKIQSKKGITPVEQGIIERDVLRGVEEAERAATETVMKMLVDHVASGADDVYKEAMKPKGLMDYVGRIVTRWTRDLGETFLKSDITALRLVGSTFVETGAGFGGGARRKGTAALIRDTEYRQSVTPMILAYRNFLEKFAHTQNATKPELLYAMENAGINSGITDRFNKLVHTEIENRKQGTGVRSQEEGIAEFVDEWKKYMDSNHDKLVDANIDGFTKQRRVENYIPHIWKYHLMDKAIREHGFGKVQRVLAKGYLTSSQVAKVPLTEQEALDKAYDLVEWVREQANLDKKDIELGEDPFMPTLDSRARSRAEINTLAEVDGLSVMDLLDTDVVGNGIRYSNRLAGWLSISKATDGKINSHRKIGALRRFIVQESMDKGADAAKNGQLYDDVIEMLFGRPTRGGLAPELRMLKDMTALTRMGGLGTAQLIESGQVIARSMLNLFSDPKTVGKVLKAAKVKASEDDLLNELQTFTGIRDDMEFLERQSVHLDQEDLQHVSAVRKASLWTVDKLTFGSLKAPAGRLLGKTTGFNMVRRAQTRVNQMSFITDVANHFKHGTGKMGNARMADLGLTEVDGTDVDLEAMFKQHAEFSPDGQLRKLNIEKWSQEARDKLNLAMIRDDAQNVQRTHIGELPTWMNSPMMSLLMQFREMPLVAMNKSLRRNMAFADKEAVVGFVLNAMFAGLVRWSKFAALGYAAAQITDQEWVEPNQEKMDTAKYITQFGLYSDLYDLVLDSRKAVEESDVDKVLNTIPVLGLMQDYSDATGITEEQRRTQLDSVQGLTPLGNTAYGDALFVWLNEKFGE